ncbi:hypothetical protein WA1_34450 [Scytonema hofmannii PCC 7110]|uniref:Glycosyltransferase RgtA/B/C/D-like domain-containing protein n=1 Tax=Scytonema hofmannii PCC 7110 TaxID=128403 RepID=A0A139X312_9CYAN|nr:hypothetical protein [Scytonema hofmannii]KYC39088.1 hypothetical protein WA1_34450 [Scytonema hofmannii PCC 7110]
MVFKRSTILLFILAILPTFVLGILVINYSVDFPYWDQWAIATLFEKIENSSLSFSDLIAQHNESRKFFPRLIFIALGYWTHWNVKYEMSIIFFLACLVSINIYLLCRKTVPVSVEKKLLIATVSNLLIFSPIQYENWLWGIQIVVFIPMLCLTTCIVAAYSHLNIKIKFFIVWGLCTIATFSYANGLLCWILAIPILVFKSRNSLLKRTKWLVLVSLLAFTINIITYFYNYVKPAHHPKFTEALAHPLQAVHYFLSFLGAPLGFGSAIDTLTVTTLVGFISLALFSSALAYLVILKETILLDSLAGWITIGLYTIISGLITTSGRVGFGVRQSLDSRYTTFSVYLLVALIHILVILVEHLKSHKYFSKIKYVFKKIVPFLFVIFLLLHLQTSVEAFLGMKKTRINRLQGKACLLFINVVEEECLTQKVTSYDAPNLKKRANLLDSLGFFRPSLIKNRIIEDAKTNKEEAQDNYGWFDNLTKIKQDVYVASGWAILPHRGEPADSVILTYKDVNGKSNIFAIVDNMGIKRSDVAKVLHNGAFKHSGWQTSFSSGELPTGSTQLNAWAFDAYTGNIYKLNGTSTLQNKQ